MPEPTITVGQTLAKVPIFSGLTEGELSFLAPFKAGLFRLHGTFIVGVVLLLFFNLSALYYGIARWLLLGDTGRKLRHVDHQLTTRDAVLDELGRDLTA